jgi:hypothetical protein
MVSACNADVLQHTWGQARIRTLQHVFLYDEGAAIVPRAAAPRLSEIVAGGFASCKSSSLLSFLALLRGVRPERDRAGPSLPGHRKRKRGESAAIGLWHSEFQQIQLQICGLYHVIHSEHPELEYR